MSAQRSIVKWFDAKRGYGFIVHPDGEADIFVHYSSIQTEDTFKTLRKEQGVTFDLEKGAKGLHAVNVVPDEEAEDVDAPLSEHADDPASEDDADDPAPDDADGPAPEDDESFPETEEYPEGTH